jgi:antitoxin component of RelBE/YafQ-DinJ toxin-antitoxin module
MARDAWLKVRIDPEEKEKIQARAAEAGMTVADLVRAALEDARLPDRAAAAALGELARQVARIGNNLNQIAAWANTHKSAGDAVQVVAHLAAIERELADVYKSFSEG